MGRQTPSLNFAGRGLGFPRSCSFTDWRLTNASFDCQCQLGRALLYAVYIRNSDNDCSRCKVVSVTGEDKEFEFMYTVM